MHDSSQQQDTKWKAELAETKAQEQTRVQEMELKMRNAAAGDEPQLLKLKQQRDQDLQRISELERKLTSDTESLRKSQQEQHETHQAAMKAIREQDVQKLAEKEKEMRQVND